MSTKCEGADLTHRSNPEPKSQQFENFQKSLSQNGDLDRIERAVRDGVEGLEDAPALVARIARLLVLCSVMRLRTLLGLGAWVEVAAGIATRWSGPEEGEVAAALVAGWPTAVRSTGPELRGRLAIVVLLGAIEHASRLGRVPDPWDMQALAERTREGVRSLAIAAAWGTWASAGGSERTTGDAVRAGVEIARWLWLVAALEAERSVSLAAADDPRTEFMLIRVLEQIQAGRGSSAVRDRVAVVLVCLELPQGRERFPSELCEACGGTGICAGCEGKARCHEDACRDCGARVVRGAVTCRGSGELAERCSGQGPRLLFGCHPCETCGGFGICAACEGRQVASPPTSRPWWERDDAAEARPCPVGLRCELAPGHGGTHHAEPDDDAGEDPREACDVCGAAPGKNCEDPRSCERERGPRPGEDGQRVVPVPCDRFRPFGPAPGYCWCGWFRDRHAAAGGAS